MQDKLIARIIDGQDFNQVVAYGFVTEEGVEDELQAILERNSEADEEEYEIMEYCEAVRPRLYYDGENFSRTFTGAEARV